MKIQLIVAKRTEPTRRALTEALRRVGIETSSSPQERIVSYGVHIPNDSHQGHNRVLNGNAGRLNKFEELVALKAYGIRVPDFHLKDDTTDFKFPMLARTKRHHGGKDIMITMSPREIPWRIAAGADYFTTYIPSYDEQRIWVFGEKHLASYQKVMNNPEKYTGFGRNHTNGYGFQIITQETLNKEAIGLAKRSLQALSLNFAAVDILFSDNGQLYVLEVNTAPGIDSPDRQHARLLANHISEWANQ